MSVFNKIRVAFRGGVTGYEPKIIISVGVNASSDKEAKDKVRLIAKVIEIKLGDYLEQFPYKIEVK